MKKADFKIVAYSTVGVLIAGFIMSTFSDLPGVSQARDGYR